MRHLTRRFELLPVTPDKRYISPIKETYTRSRIRGLSWTAKGARRNHTDVKNDPDFYKLTVFGRKTRMCGFDTGGEPGSNYRWLNARRRLGVFHARGFILLAWTTDTARISKYTGQSHFVFRAMHLAVGPPFFLLPLLFFFSAAELHSRLAAACRPGSLTI